VALSTPAPNQVERKEKKIAGTAGPACHLGRKKRGSTESDQSIGPGTKTVTAGGVNGKKAYERKKKKLHGRRLIENHQPKNRNEDGIEGQYLLREPHTRMESKRDLTREEDYTAKFQQKDASGHSHKRGEQKGNRTNLCWRFGDSKGVRGRRKCWKPRILQTREKFSIRNRPIAVYQQDCARFNSLRRHETPGQVQALETAKV